MKLIDLLADDGPQEAIVDGRRLDDAELFAVFDEAGETEFSGEAGEGGGVLIETEDAGDDTVNLQRAGGR